MLVRFRPGAPTYAASQLRLAGPSSYYRSEAAKVAPRSFSEAGRGLQISDCDCQIAESVHQASLRARNPSEAVIPRRCAAWKNLEISLVTLASRNDVDKHRRSRRALRSSYARNVSPLKIEGAGNAGCPMHPQPRARWVVKYAHEYSQRRHRITSGIPHAMVLTAYFALSPVTSSFLPPSPHGLKVSRARLGRLTPPQGLASATDARTTRLRRPQQCRSSCVPIIAHEPLNPPCDISCTHDIVASTASRTQRP